MAVRAKMGARDDTTKKGHVVRIVNQGDKVKFTFMFRGRERQRPELGFRLLQRLAEDVGELGFVESAPRQDGRNMIMVIGPHKKKAEARAAVKAAKVQAAADRDEQRAADVAADKADRAEHRLAEAGAKKPRRRSESLDPDT